MKRHSGFAILLFFILSFLLVSCGDDNGVVDENQTIYDNLDAVCDSVLNQTNITGIVAAVWAPDQEIEYIFTDGIANIETQEMMSENFYFRIGSNTKTMVVTRVLQLVDEGKISLDETFDRFFPNFPKSDSVTIEMLANMTSGIVDYMDTDAFNYEMDNNPTRVWTKDELIDLVRQEDYLFQPGDQFMYCNTNTQILGRIIEMVTGHALENEINQYIFSPLGLSSTTFPVSGTQMPDPHPKGYFIGDYDPEYPEFSEHFDISWAQAAGCAISNIYDLKQIVIAMNNGFYLSDSLQEMRINNRVAVNSFVDYAIGGFYFYGYFGHGGDIAGFSSAMFHSMEKNCTIILWYNSLLDEVRPMHQVLLFDEIIFGEH